MLRKAFEVVVLLTCVWVMAGCHTVKGVGQDVESGGRAIERGSGK